ncbi:MAG: hypothetical protein ABIR96_12520 [Bdellovibrionota bacterium]
MASSSMAGGLDRSVKRGDETQSFPVAGAPAEICVVPKHLPGAEYRGKDGAKDRDRERQLCSYDLHKDGPTSETHGVGACPKISSTSASIEFQELVAANTKESIESIEKCGRERPTDKLTKFKTTDNDRTCTYAPGAMLTYHLSRYLGDILEVPAMVLRTIDLDVMQKVAVNATKMKINGVLRKSYQNYIDAYRDPSRADMASSIYTSDLKQLFGFLRDNVKADFTHPGWVDGVQGGAFEGMEGVRDAFSSTPAATIFGKQLSQVSLQRLQTARDYADLIVLDQLSSQSDRYTGLNLGGVNYYYFRDGDKNLSSVEKRKVDKGEKPLPAGALLIRRVVSKDNDCTFINGNVNAKLGYTARLRHINPKTYAGVQKLARAFTADSQIKDFMLTDLNMAQRYIDIFAKNLSSVSDTLRENCRSGALKLDLNPEANFLGAESAQSCE